MGFTLNASMVEGNLFKESGKWKYNICIDMTGLYDAPDLYQAVVDAFRRTPPDIRGVIDNITGYWLVVPEPYHRNAYPVMVKI